MAKASAMWIEPSTPSQMGLDLRMTEMGLDLRIGNSRQIEGGHTDHRGHDRHRALTVCAKSVDQQRVEE